MANQRILIGAEALFVGPTPCTGAQPSGNILQLHRVQNFSYDFSRSLENVNQAGDLAPIDRITLTAPTVNLNATYLSTNVYNEQAIGLYVSGDRSALSSILDGSQIDKNYFIRVAPDGNSANGYTGTDGGVYGIGNGYLASYQAQGAVGSFPTAQFTVQALNMNFSSTSVSIDTPAIDPSSGGPITGLFLSVPTPVTGLAGQPTALKPGNITVNLSGAGLGVSGLCINKYDISFSLNLEPIQCLGSEYPSVRVVKFPIECKFTVDALVKDLGTGNLANFRCNDPKYNMDVTIRKPTCVAGTQGAVQAFYSIKNASLESQNFNDTQGANKTVTMTFSSQIGSANQLNNGLFISGSLV